MKVIQEEVNVIRSKYKLWEEYNPNEYLDFVIGLENEPEKGERCLKCIELRLIKTFKKTLFFDTIIK